MEGMKSLLQILNDFLHLLVSTFGFCLAITKHFVSNVFHFFYYVFYQQTSFLLQNFMWLPVTIAISVILQFVFLPLNIPLKLLAGTSLQKIVGHANDKTNIYIIMTILQYSLVLVLLGVIFGVICGLSLSLIHFLIVIPDVKFDISLSFIRKIIPRVSLPKMNLGFLTQIPTLSQFNRSDVNEVEKTKADTSIEVTPGEDLEEIIARTTSTPYNINHKKSWQRCSISSKDSIMEMASKLPSDFFQKRGSVSEMNRATNQSLGHSPSSRVGDDSSYSSSNLWDQFDELPSTLRTEGGVSTLYSRRPTNVANREEGMFTTKMKSHI